MREVWLAEAGEQPLQWSPGTVRTPLPVSTPPCKPGPSPPLPAIYFHDLPSQPAPAAEEVLTTCWTLGGTGRRPSQWFLSDGSLC